MIPSNKSTGITQMTLAIGISLLITACSFRGEFHEPALSSPHALLTADNGLSWRDRGPTVFAINSQPTSFWRRSEKCRIPPGKTVLTIIADQEPYGFSPLRFSARQGKHYHLRYGEYRRFVALYEITNAKKPTLIAKSPRDKKQGEQGRAHQSTTRP